MRIEVKGTLNVREGNNVRTSIWLVRRLQSRCRTTNLKKISYGPDPSCLLWPQPIWSLPKTIVVSVTLACVSHPGGASRAPGPYPLKLQPLSKIYLRSSNAQDDDDDGDDGDDDDDDCRMISVWTCNYLMITKFDVISWPPITNCMPHSMTFQFNMLQSFNIICVLYETGRTLTKQIWWAHRCMLPQRILVLGPNYTRYEFTLYL